MKQTSASMPTILIVEDDPLIRLVGTMHLADAGFSVLEACNAEEALRLLERRGSRVDLVFTDIEMPGALDGLGLARCIHEQWPAIAVIMTSGRCEPPQGWTGPRDMFVAKPYAGSVLMEKIATCLSAKVLAVS